MESRDYWEDRLGRHPDLTGTGHRAFDARYNAWIYRALRDALDDALAAHRVEVAGRSILDVGSGTGYWLGVLQALRPDRLAAVELTSAAARRLVERYPHAEVFQADISEALPALSGPYDLVTAISVLFHVVDDRAFERAVRNLAACVASGGWLVISGIFRRRRLPSAVHVRFRAFDAYRLPLEAGGLEIVELRPALYLLQRTFVPIVGPVALSALRMGRWLYRIDRFLARRGWPNGFQQKLLIAHRPADVP